MQHPPVVVRNLTVPLDRGISISKPLRIAHVSDLHLRRLCATTRAAQQALLDVDCDIVVATGDFCVSPKRWEPVVRMMREFFGPVADRHPVFAVLGNHDNAEIATAPDMPLIFLNNRSVRFDWAGGVANIAGVEQLTRDAADIDAALAGRTEQELTVLLAHYPSTVFRLPPGRVALQLSGHTHGGQIRFPWIGSLWNNDRIPRAMARGLHRVAGTPVHVNPGIGVSLPIHARINCPPEVTLLTLESAVVSGGGPPASSAGERQMSVAAKV